MAAKPKPVKGCKVRLLHDITTRGGRTFRAGVVMTLQHTHGEYHLRVVVRAKHHYLTLKKRDYPRAFSVVWSPPRPPLTEDIMPTAVPIEFFRIGKTQVDEKEVQRWLDFVGVTDPVAFLADALDQGVTSPALNIALAGKRCYKSFEEGLNPNVTRIRKHYDAYFENILASGHGSVLEHSVYTYAIENVSRVFTAEMNRHRAGWAISEGSLRFIRFGENIPYWQPDSVTGPDVLDESSKTAVELTLWGQHPSAIGPTIDTLDQKKHATRMALTHAFTDQERVYRFMESVWRDELAPTSTFKGKKEITSMMRRIVGLGVATGGVWTGNVRALRHVITMRASPQAEEEMLHVWSRIAKHVRDDDPMLFGDFEQTDGGYWVPKYIKV